MTSTCRPGINLKTKFSCVSGAAEKHGIPLISVFIHCNRGRDSFFRPKRSSDILRFRPGEFIFAVMSDSSVRRRLSEEVPGIWRRQCPSCRLLNEMKIFHILSIGSLRHITPCVQEEIISACRALIAMPLQNLSREMANLPFYPEPPI